MARIGLRLSRLHQLLIYITFGVLLVSGCAWLIARYFSSGQIEIQTYTLSSLMMKIHGAAAMVSLLLLGSLAADHMYAGWKARKNHQSGVAMAVLNVVLIISAYGLYYFGEELVRDWTSYIHSVIGIALVPLFLFHVKRGLKLYK